MLLNVTQMDGGWVGGERLGQQFRTRLSLNNCAVWPNPLLQAVKPNTSSPKLILDLSNFKVQQVHCGIKSVKSSFTMIKKREVVKNGQIHTRHEHFTTLYVQ